MRTSGPVPARIAIIGEAPGREEEIQGLPFVGASGGLLNSLLQKSGILRNSCFIANVCNHRPPDNDMGEWLSDNKRPPSPEWVHINDKWAHPHVAAGLSKLLRELDEVKPDIIIALGNTPLWALTGNSGIQKWRGSRLKWKEAILVSSIHPAAALREMSLAPVLLMDFKRAVALLEGRQKPRDYRFRIQPSFVEAVTYLTDLIARADDSPETILLSGDLETRLGHIACIGIATSPEDAFCIPFLELNLTNPFYWPADQEATIVHLLIRLLMHPRIQWVGQNFLYDCQYFHRFWGVSPRAVWDTMIGHHSIYSNMRKGLDFLSAMYAQDHVYWKDEIKEWEPGVGERQFWTYNCKDACITWEIWHQILAEQAAQGVSQHFYFQQSLFQPVLRMMNRGVRIDTAARGTWDPIIEKGTGLKAELCQAFNERQKNLEFMAGHPLNPKSPKQLLNFFYKDLGVKAIHSLATEAVTTNSPALQTIATRNPVLQPLCQTIAELRSLGVFLSTFIDASLDTDGRMRCSFSIAGPTTFRFSSSENAFGSGMNLQNVPIVEKVKVKGPNNLRLPNIRRLFIPDVGYIFFDMDLDRADLQVVVWEADDADLKLALRKNLDTHCFNACDIFDIKGIPLDELAEDHPNYRDHRGRIGESYRAKAKMGVHATNYGVGDYKLAQSLGITVREASLFRARWFGAHPGIREWHLRTETNAAKFGYVENRFGARLNILGRFDLPEALAWTPQSTVAGVINRAFIRLDAAEQAGDSSIQVLIQVHDSLAGQFRADRFEEEVRRLETCGLVQIPYDDPLTIPVGIKTSTKSWGDCK